MEDQPTWQKVTSEAQEATYQMKVPGGWLYRTIVASGPQSVGIAMCVVPAPPKPDAEMMQANAELQDKLERLAARLDQLGAPPTKGS
jgi:hypothetical protein